jgi:hypothetical protein
MLPNYQRDMANNGRNMLSNRGAWPWHVPQQSTWWNPFSWQQGSNNNGYQNNQFAGSSYGYGNQYDPYAGINPYGGYPYGVSGDSPYWSGWNDYDDWNNWNSQYDNAPPFYGDGMDSGPLSLILSMFRGGGSGYDRGHGGAGTTGGGPNNNWMSNLLYFTGYSIGGNTYPDNYFAMNGYAPTPYVFDVASGQFWQPSVGFADYLPNNYRAPITVSVQEVVPSFDGKGSIVGYQPQTFYYNAYWDNDAQSYGYYDYRNKFHWLTFPWLSTYSNEYAAR